MGNGEARENGADRQAARGNGTNETKNWPAEQWNEIRTSLNELLPKPEGDGPPAWGLFSHAMTFFYAYYDEFKKGEVRPRTRSRGKSSRTVTLFCMESSSATTL